MNLKIKLLFFLTGMLSLTSNHGMAQGYEIGFKVDGVENKMCYLGNYFGDKTYLQDSAMADAQGNFTFRGDEALPGGVYLAVLPDKKFFEVIVDEDQHFKMETSANDPIKQMKVKGSSDNALFYEYLGFAGGKQIKIQQLRGQLKSAEGEREKSKIQKLLDEETSQLGAFRRKFIEEHSGSFVSVIFKASEEPEIPPAPILANGREDSTFAYRYYKQHYFDNFDLSDGRLVRTPAFHKKIEKYIEQLTLQIPDSIIAAADHLVALTKENPESFKYVVWYITNTYEKSKYMGMDAVFVHMVENYYTKEKASWLDDTQLFKIQDRARTLKPLLIGKKVKNLVMTDTSGVYQSLYALKSRFTVLYFWDPDCGHCKKVTPQLKEFYEKMNEKSVEVFAICTEIEIDKWKAYIEKYELEWINVADPNLRNNFRADFDISSTPQIYLLDKEKKIIAKKLSVEQLEEIVKLKLKEES